MCLHAKNISLYNLCPKHLAFLIDKPLGQIYRISKEKNSQLKLLVLNPLKKQALKCQKLKKMN